MSQLIRVGTTGDYPPFTVLNALGQFDGEDIRLFENFARALTYRWQWIQTKWINLSQDLQAGRFDAAIGGISYTTERAQQFLVSEALKADAKVILCHRDFAPYFTNKDLADFDRPELRFIYNPGGTNEKIAKAKLQHATLVLEQDMEAIFKRLAQKEVTAFITDIHEAEYRSALSEGRLVAINTDRPILKTTMVCLFRQDQVLLRERFNQWLLQQT